MKAVRLKSPGGLSQLVIGSCELATVGRGEISVRVHASSLNYHDYAVVTGNIKTPDGRIPMSDGAGEVLAVGPDVTEFAIGDRVVSTFSPNWLDGERSSVGFTAVPGDGADGFAREAVTMPVSAFTRAPAGYSHTEAATLTCAGLTAWRALFADGNGPLKPGDIVLVQGTGGVSIFALQFAKAAGATVIATSSSDEKLARLKSLGADHLINYRTDEKWGATAFQLTGDRGVDHVVEIGGAGTLNQSIAASRNGGHIALIGVLAGFSGTVSTLSIMRKQLRVQGLTVGNRRQQLDMIRAIEANAMRPVIDSRYALEDIANAFRHQESGRHFGKICLEF
jgi:NADPH:quinone reductase-like Zn-dependent oxidoreductase